MSFREKTAWVTLFAILIMSGMYWVHVHNPFVPHDQHWVLASLAVSLGTYVLIEIIAWLVLRWRFPQDAREPRDERERLIDLKALRIAHYVFAVGALAGIFFVLHLAGAGPVAVASTVFTAFVLAQVVKHAARIVYYRRGF